jgi:hypothetical protein
LTWPFPPMLPSVMSSADLPPGWRFLIDGTVVDRNPATRVLRLHLEPLVVMPTVPSPPPSEGDRVFASGQVDAEGRWVVTELARATLSRAR